jgi:hypothetical protein
LFEKDTRRVRVVAVKLVSRIGKTAEWRSKGENPALWGEPKTRKFGFFGWGPEKEDEGKLKLACRE